MTRATKTSSKAPEPILSRDERVDHFRIVRLVKRGGMGEVYLARDMRLGRRVALKLIRGEKLSSVAAREHLLAEARATARFNHPNIVTIFHVGEHRSMPYLALEYLEGDTLRDRLGEEHMGVSEAVRIGVAIARAVQEAHSHSMCHRDLKPENVVLPPDGRLRVVDFGLAVEEELRPATSPSEVVGEDEATAQGVGPDESAGMVWGSPQYMAPEVWRHQPGGAPADMWALGIILYELASSTRPYEGLKSAALWEEVCSARPAPALPNRADLPRDLTRLIEGCLVKEQRQRLVIDDVVVAMEGLLHGRRRVSSGEQSPFPGLRPFDEDHADVFFGRDAEVAEFLERLRHEPLLPVIGPSGAGKSSFVQAGVLPRLRDQGFWKAITLRPGSHPFESLAAHLLELEGELDPSDIPTETVRFRQTAHATLPVEVPDPDGEDPEQDLAIDATELAGELREAPGRLALRLNDFCRWGKFRLVLFVDQLEELYTLVDDEETRMRFMSALCTAAEDGREPVRVVFTLRDDFLGRVAQGPQTRKALSRVMLIRSPAPEALTEILERPLHSVGYRWEDDGLVERMVEDVRGELTSLPLLQFATQTLWDRRDRDRRVLRRAAYERMGGVAGALAEHADAVLEELSPAQLRVARQVLLRLVTAEGTRQVVQRGRLVEELDEGAHDVVSRLVRARLLALRRSDLAEAPEEAEVELVHESLVVTWGRLARWISEGREELAFLAEIGQAAQLWDRRGRRDEEVWQGEALQEASRWLGRVTVRYPPAVADFVRAGRSRRDRVRRNRLARRRLVTAVLVLMALAAIVVAWQFSRTSRVVRRQERVAQGQRMRAVRQQIRAEQRHAEAQREGARAALARGALLEARAKLRVSLETLDSPLARALWWQLKRHSLAWRKNLGSTVYVVHFSPDGRTLAAGCQDGSIYLIDVRTLEVRFLRGHKDQIFALDFSSDGKRLASGSWNGDVRLWDVAQGTSVSWRAHKALIWGVAFSPDGREVVTGAYDGNIRIWKTTSAHPRRLEIKAGHRVSDVAFSPDGRTIVSAHRNRAVVAWDARKGRQLWVSRTHRLGLSSVRFSPDGLTLATGGQDGTVRILDAKTGTERRVLRGHSSAVAQVAYSRDGRLLASAGPDRFIRLWDAATGRRLRTLRGHTGEVRGIYFSPDGKTLASGSYDKTVRLWQLAAPKEQKVQRGHTALTYGVAFHPSAPRVASGAFDGTIRIWDVVTGRQRTVIRAPGPVMGIDYAPDGGTIAAGCTDGTVRLWAAESGVERRVLRGHTSRVLEVKYSPDGKWLVSGSYDRTVRLWEVATGEVKATLRGQNGAIHGVAFDRQGRRIATGSRDGTIWIWDVATGQVRRILRGHGVDAYGVVFGVARDTLFSTNSGGDLRQWDLKTGTSQVLAKQRARAYFLDVFGAAGAGLRVGVPGSDHAARLWAPPWKKPLVLRGHRGEVNVLRFGRQGKVAATSSDDSTLRLWDTATGRPFWRAPILMGATAELLTHRGWQTLIDAPKARPRPRSVPKAKWRAAIEQRARLASEHLASGLICVRTYDVHLELWDQKEDRRLLRRAVAGLHEVRALPSGCLTLALGSGSSAGGVAQIHQRTASARTLSREATAVHWSQGQILVATAKRVHVFDAWGRPRGEYPAPAGVRALALVHRWLVLGNRDGNIELVPTTSGATRPRFTFEDVPSSPVVGLAAGPMSTLIVGFANGLLGIWNLANGSRLYSARLHGPVRHLRRVSGRLYAATELGDHLVVDLRVFDRSYCDLVREVWSRVPVVWQGGLTSLQPPPPLHRCRP